jgi:hypothetical protein
MRQILIETLQRNGGHLSDPDVPELTVEDLKQLFLLYDRIYFGGILSRQAGNTLTFRLSNRMTRNAGKLSYRKNDMKAELCISTRLLYLKDVTSGKPVLINGIECHSRLAVLLTIFEHELTHWIELNRFGNTSCKRKRFQDLSLKLFGHTGVTHHLGVHNLSKAGPVAVKPGDTVSFVYRKIRLTGTVIRITKRATIMVEERIRSTKGSPVVKRLKFYVPLSRLTLSA